MIVNLLKTLLFFKSRTLIHIMFILNSQQDILDAMWEMNPLLSPSYLSLPHPGELYFGAVILCPEKLLKSRQVLLSNQLETSQ